MKSNLTAIQRTNLEKELHGLMLFANKNDSEEKIIHHYNRAGEIMVLLDLIDATHKNTPEIIARVYAQYTRNKIDHIVNKRRD